MIRLYAIMLIGLCMLLVACSAPVSPTTTPEPAPGPTSTEIEPTATGALPTATATSAPTMPSPTPSSSAQTYRDVVWGVHLQYPQGWEPQAGYDAKYAGPDGFFQLSAIDGSGWTLDEVAESDAHHKLQPYGTEPTIERVEVDGLEARLILPSADQPEVMKGQAGLILDLPWQIEISGEKYDYLVLWADQQHIRAIAATMHLVKPASGAVPTATAEVPPPSPTAAPAPTALPPCSPLLQQQACWITVQVVDASGAPAAVAVGFLVYLPEGYDQTNQQSWPLILFLHGSEERGSDPRSLARQGLPKVLEQRSDLPFIVVSPQCREGQWWWPQTHILSAFVDKIEAEYAVDSKRIYVTGLSMGGYGAWALAYKYPERFAAVAPIAGGHYDGTNLLPADICRLRDVPIWAFHGAKDALVLPDESERVVNALKACGGDVRFTLYPEAAHTQSWELAYDDPELYQWLLEHQLQ